MSNNSKGSSLFLIELAFVVLIFSVCAAVCIGVFAQAQTMSRESDNLSKSVLVAETLAENYKASGGDLSLLGGTDNGDGGVIILYDNTWSPTTGGRAFYALIYSENGYADIRIYAVGETADTELYRLTAKVVI